MSDFVSRLRDLSTCKHSDLSIGNEAADRIEQLERELAEAQRDAGRYAYLKQRIEYDELSDGCTYAHLDWCVDVSSLAPGSLEEAIDKARGA